MTSRRIGVALAALLTLSGCVPSAGEVEYLINQSWQVTSLPVGVSGAAGPILDDAQSVRSVLQVEQRNIGGNIGCYGITGDVRFQTEHRVRFANLTTTAANALPHLPSCMPGDEHTAQRLIAALNGQTLRWTRHDDQLVLSPEVQGEDGIGTVEFLILP